jgi:pimeloyl-ACP methyl ester carboxylesterase
LAESTAQAIAEIRALTGWLLGEDCPAVALWGLSMGGWLAGMTASRDARLAAAVLAAPGVRLTLSYAEQIAWPRLRKVMMGQCAAYEALNQTSLNLTMAQPVIPRENILLLEGIHDLFARRELIEELWQTWGQPDIWRRPCGHISFPGGAGFNDRVLRWLAPRLDKPAVQQRQNNAAEPSASPNGGPATRFASTDATEGPPSAS